MHSLTSRQKTLANSSIDKAVREHFPFGGKWSKSRWQTVFRRFEKATTSSTDEADYFRQVEFLFGAWGDAHTKLRDYPTKRWYSPAGFRVEKKKSAFLLIRRGQLLGRLLSIDGQTVEQYIAHHEKRIAASTPWYRRLQAEKFLLLSTTEGQGECVVRRGTIERTIHFTRRPHRPTATPTAPTLTFKNGVAFVLIPTWVSTPTLESELNAIITKLDRRKPRHITIDVRGNGGGNSTVAQNVAAHFFRLDVASGVKHQRIAKTQRWVLHRFPIKPIAPYISARLTLLIDGHCLSSNEYFIAILHDNGRATTVGSVTGGSSGNPKTIPLALGASPFSIQVATWRYVRPNGKQLEGRGIAPDVRRY